jgi:6,7-dimethyl-8-ribityllumazine synthase
MRFAFVVSRYDFEIAQGLENGAHAYLREQSLEVRPEDVFEAPGAFEIPLIAQELARSGRYAGVVCMGCVIRGETAHFDYICQSAASGILQASLETRTPIAFGVLTVLNRAQALARSRADDFNKGREAAAACYQTARILSRVK